MKETKDSSTNGTHGTKFAISIVPSAHNNANCFLFLTFLIFLPKIHDGSAANPCFQVIAKFCRVFFFLCFHNVYDQSISQYLLSEEIVRERLAAIICNMCSIIQIHTA